MNGADDSGQPESLYGRINLSEMGIRASRDKPPSSSRKPAKKSGASSRDARAAFDSICLLTTGFMDEQPDDVVRSAVDEVVSIMNSSLPEADKKSNVCQVFMVKDVDNERFIQLANLCSKAGSTPQSNDDILAVSFHEASEDGEEDDVIGIIESLGQEDEGEDAVVVDDEAVDGWNGRRRVNLESLAFPLGSHTMTNKKCRLPEQTFKKSMPGYEEIHIPAPRPFHSGQSISVDELPEFYRRAFSSVPRLNHIQSTVAPQIVASDSNVLVCAPTGAGKTNIALLAIIKELQRYPLDAVKIVYIAPMKALVQEVVGKLRQTLDQYGVSVAELTGDSVSTRKDLVSAQVIVATPEKWDVVSRKSNDLSYCRLVRLMIFDEIHLLHDERGPVLEAIIMRAFHDVERFSEPCRIVALSATLPNFHDVARFIKAPQASTFHFDQSHRPCPLRQVFIGVTERRPLKRVNIMNEALCNVICERLGQHQMLVFVHSRKDAVKTAELIRDRLVGDGLIGKILCDSDIQMSSDFSSLARHGIGVHHAGMTRSDRSAVEQSFASGQLSLLVSTATLAWGVNLPAHTVIIKGTQVYRPDRAAWCPLSGQDVLQMLGRAGRPQYDSEGEGVVITEDRELTFYMSLSTMQLPIESQMVSQVTDHLNAAVCSGFVDSLASACKWLRSSYLYIRMLADPSSYHVANVDERVEDICHSALVALHRDRLVEYDRANGDVDQCELGRIAAHYYLPTASAAIYHEHLGRASVSEIDVFRIFSLSFEFRQMSVRREERFEIQRLIERVPIPVKEAHDDRLAKVNILLQSYMSGYDLSGLALQADMIYITQSAVRIFRAMFEVACALKKGRLSRMVLELAQSVEHQQWPVHSPLYQLSEAIPADMISRLERKEFQFERLFDLSVEELGELMRQPAMGSLLFKALQCFPRIQVTADVVPISSECLELNVTVTPTWSDSRYLDHLEVFRVFVEDGDGARLFCADTVVFNSDHLCSAVKLIRVPWDLASPFYFITCTSDRWLGTERRLPIPLKDLRAPTAFQKSTVVQDRKPVIVDGHRLSPVQTQSLDIIHNLGPGKSAFLALPPGCGRQALVEAAICNLASAVVILHPKRAFVDRVLSRQPYSWPTVKLTGDVSKDMKHCSDSGVLIGTTEDFELATRRWRSKRSILQNVGMIVIHDVHLMDAQLEILLSRLRFIQSQSAGFRLLAFSDSVLNGLELGEWVSDECLSFDSTLKAVHVATSPIAHVSSMIIALSRAAFACTASHALVFVDNWQQARQTCLDFSLFAEKRIDDANTSDSVLKETVPYGIAYLHESLPESDQGIVMEMFRNGQVTHLIIPSSSIWSFEVDSCKSVVLLGCASYSQGSVVDWPEAQVSRMVSFAEDVHIFCHRSSRYHQGSVQMVIESSLGDCLNDHLGNAVSTKLVSTKQDAVDWLTWTFMYRRLANNPSYYKMASTDVNDEVHLNMAISAFLSELVEDAVQSLVSANCLVVDQEGHLVSTNYGLIAAHHGISVSTIDMFVLSATPNTKLRGILEMISAATEYDHLIGLPNQWKSLESLYQAVPIKLHDRLDDAHVRTNVLLQSHFSRITLPPDLQGDLYYIVPIAIKLISALVDVLSVQSWLEPICAAADFAQMLVNGIWEHQSALLCLPGVSMDMIDEAYRAKQISSVYDFVDCDDDEWKRLWLQQVDRGTLKLAIHAINKYPSIQASARFESNQVVITVDRDLEDSLSVIAPRFPGVKEEQWWLVIAHEKQVLAIKKIAFTEEHSMLTIDCENTAMRPLKCLLLCDSYPGCDQEIKVLT